MLTIKRLDVDDANVLIDGARAKAAEIDVPMCIAVTDESGNLIAFERMNGAKIPSVEIAIDKSFTATGVRKGTHELQSARRTGLRYIVNCRWPYGYDCRWPSGDC